MKIMPFYLFMMLLITVFASCNKSNGTNTTVDNSFYIEATINGQDWRGVSTGDYYAVNAADYSQMKIFLDSSVTGITSFNFLTNSNLIPYSLTDTSFSLQNLVVGTFNSNILFKWQTTFERNLYDFVIEEYSSQTKNYVSIALIYAAGTTTTRQQYSYPLNLSSYTTSDNLDSLRFRIKIVENSGKIHYTNTFPVNYTVSKAQIAYTTANGPVYFALDNNQNQISITSYDPTTKERRGTFSFNYIDDSGNVIAVTNGKFHLKK